MKKLKSAFLRSPLTFSILVLVLTVVITEIPLNTLFEKIFDLQTAYYLSTTIEQSACAAAIAVFIARAGILRRAGMVRPQSLKNLWIVWPILALAVINGWSLFDGSVAIDPSKPLILFMMIALSTGFYEEILCRGLILSACLKKWGKTRNGIYQAVIFASVIFGLFHLINLVMGRGTLLEVITQIIYATFFGVFFAACFLRLGSIWPAIITHTLFDMMGTMDEITIGNKFTGHVLNTNYSLENALTTILLTLPLFLYGLFILRKVKPETLNKIYDFEAAP
jgi:membrane protease YdiL (CAAX protease family)